MVNSRYERMPRMIVLTRPKRAACARREESQAARIHGRCATAPDERETLEHPAGAGACADSPLIWMERSGRGPSLLPGATELVADLRHEGLGVVFASNCSRHGSPLLCRQLADLGIATTPSEVFTPFDLVGEEVKRGSAPVPVLVIGTDDVARGAGSLRVIRQFRSIAGTRPKRLSSESTTISATIACGRPRERSRPGRRFSRSIWMHGSRSGQASSIPAAGHSRRLSRVASGVRPDDHRQTRTAALRVRHRPAQLPAHQAAMVGDSTASDITGGKAAGMFTIWLDPEDDDIQPDCADLKVRGLPELHQLWRQARTDSRASL